MAKHQSFRFLQSEWEALLEYYDHTCLGCGTREGVFPDHVHPLSQGGADHISNVQPLCRSCNARKRNATIDYRDGVRIVVEDPRDTPRAPETVCTLIDFTSGTVLESGLTRKAATTRARRRARAGAEVLVEGPELRRLYTPKSVRGRGGFPRWPYLIPLPCGHWGHPSRRESETGRCRGCYLAAQKKT